MTVRDRFRRVPWDEAERWVADTLAASGFARDHADATAWGLCEAEAGGITTHGLMRTLQYVASVASGDIDATASPTTVKDDGSTLLSDARGGYGYLAMRDLVDRLAVRASERGIAVGGVRNSHHYGAGWLYASRVARRGAIAIIMTNATANLAGPGGRRAVIGNNPLSIAAPGSDERGPLCADVAMSVVAQGRIRMADRMGEPIPYGWARDQVGQPTEDAAAALDARLLEPIGGHKGFVLATMIEVLAGALTGSPFGERSAAHRNSGGGVGHLAIVLDPTELLAPHALEDATAQLAGEISAAADGAPQATMPGWPEEERRRDALARGLRLEERVLSQLATLEDRTGRSLWGVSTVDT